MRTISIIFQAQLEKEAQEDNEYRQQLEQERRDHELAMRLAQETNSQVEDSPLLMRKYVQHLISKQSLMMGAEKTQAKFTPCTYL